jgi:outer membrane protein
MASPALFSVLALAAGAAGAELTVAEAISAALRDNPQLAAGRAQVESRRAEARARSLAGLPTLSVSGLATATNDPLIAFGMRLQERSVTAVDFEPVRLNSADVIGVLGVGAQASLPLYAGGRLAADRRTSAARAAAEEAEQRARSQQLALAVVAAYFGARIIAEEALSAAREGLEDARGIERPVQARVGRDLQQPSEAARASAFRASAEAELVVAEQRLGDARDELSLLVGQRARGARLASLLAPESFAIEDARTGERPDVEAAAQQEVAARAGAAAARSAWFPQGPCFCAAGRSGAAARPWAPSPPPAWRPAGTCSRRPAAPKSRRRRGPPQPPPRCAAGPRSRRRSTSPRRGARPASPGPARRPPARRSTRRGSPAT